MKIRKNYQYGTVKPKIQCDPDKGAQQHFKGAVHAPSIVQRYKNGVQPQFGHVRQSEAQEYGIQITQADLMAAKNKMLRGEISEFEKAVQKQKEAQDVAKANLDRDSKDSASKALEAKAASKEEVKA